MHKIDGPGHANGQFVNEDPDLGRAPTVVTPEWLNAVQGELVALVQAAGIALDKGNSAQVLEALNAGVFARFGPVGAPVQYRSVSLANCAAMVEL
jgi:hypothetical protein